MPFLALQGSRVIETAEGISGPYCGKLFAEYGADVIKVERPGDGDPSRGRSSWPSHSDDIEKSPLFLHLNRGKRGVTLDLETDAGRSLFRQLVSNADVLIESSAPGYMDSIGLGYESLRELNPGLVMTSVTPFGQTGPHKDYQYTELTIFATGGAMFREGRSDREPLKYGGEMGQYFAGTAASAATMGAYFRAFMTGQGEWIDISLQECIAGHPHQIGRSAPFVYAGESDPRNNPRQGTSETRETYGSGTFKCKDGFASFLPLGARMWPNLARMIDRPDLLDDARFTSIEGRAAHNGELESLFQDWFDSHTRAEVFAAGQREGLPCGPVLTPPDVLADPHFNERGSFLRIDHPRAGTLRYTGHPFRLSAMDQFEPKPAPLLGQHNLEVYSGLLGVGEDDLELLRSEGVL